MPTLSDLKSTEGHSCGKNFPKLWTSFIHALTDTLIANGPTVTRPRAPPPTPPPTRLPAVERLIALGDVHGDIVKVKKALKLAGLIDDSDHWSGGKATLVQVGDILDRGDHELEIFYFFERLQKEAAAAGGSFHILNGNHETMNAAGHFRYATPGAMAACSRWAKIRAFESALKRACHCNDGGHPEKWHQISRDPHRARKAAFSHGSGEITRRFLAPHPTVLQIGSTLFVHGGALPHHVNYGLERINTETRDWLSQEEAPVPEFLSGRNAIVWAREYSHEDASACDCEALDVALKGVQGAKRMVVGHTIQEEGINSACSGRVIRIDVGLSSGCGNGSPEVLEILNDKEVKRLRERVRENMRET